MIGETFGRLTVLEELGSVKNRGKRYKTLCSCGNEAISYGTLLRSGHTKSCGCLVKESAAKTGIKNKGREHKSASTKQESTYRRLYREYKASAMRRKHTFSLRYEDFVLVTSSACHYCHTPPQQIYKSSGTNNSEIVYNGIDRFDNDDGYHIGNVLPCCGRCNKMKGTLTYGQFIDQVMMIANVKPSASVIILAREG